MDTDRQGDYTDKPISPIRLPRRELITSVAGLLSAKVATDVTSAEAQTAPSPTPTDDASNADPFNFLLNIKYLQANFYSLAVSGTPVAEADTGGGVGTRGAATGGRAVTFSDPLVEQQARDIARDELAHLQFLRGQLSNATRAAQPALDLGVGPTSAFATLAQAAGLISNGAGYDVYATDEAFLLASFFFKDVSVSAYKSVVPLITRNQTLREAALGILSTEGYHAGSIRSLLYRKGLRTPSLRLIEATTEISNVRDGLDGAPGADPIRGIAPDGDQGIAPIMTEDGSVSNLMPTNENGFIFSRSPGRTLGVLYLSNAAVARGGFFPNGVNGPINTSGAT